MLSVVNIFEVWINRELALGKGFQGRIIKTIKKSFATHLSSRTNQQRTVLEKKIIL